MVLRFVESPLNSWLWVPVYGISTVHGVGCSLSGVVPLRNWFVSWVHCLLQLVRFGCVVGNAHFLRWYINEYNKDSGTSSPPHHLRVVGLFAWLRALWLCVAGGDSWPHHTCIAARCALIRRTEDKRVCDIVMVMPSDKISNGKNKWKYFQELSSCTILGHAPKNRFPRWFLFCWLSYFCTEYCGISVGVKNVTFEAPPIPTPTRLPRTIEYVVSAVGVFCQGSKATYPAVERRH